MGLFKDSFAISTMVNIEFGDDIFILRLIYETILEVVMILQFFWIDM